MPNRSYAHRLSSPQADGEWSALKLTEFYNESGKRVETSFLVKQTHWSDPKKRVPTVQRNVHVYLAAMGVHCVRYRRYIAYTKIKADAAVKQELPT